MSVEPRSSPPPTTTTSMAAQLPEIEFGFDDLKERMMAFTVRFDEFIKQGRKRILEDKNDYAKSMLEFKDNARALREDRDFYVTKEQEIKEQVKRDTAELLEAENAIADIDRKRRVKEEQKEALQAQIEEVKLAIEKKRAIRAAQRQALTQQQAKNVPELVFWEDHLGMRIDGAGVADHLKITFTHLSEPDVESWFVVSMVKRDYEVVQCRPRLDMEDVGRVADKLNETREFAGFLKDMRKLFKANATGA
ncbi:chromosome segregation protein Spc25-domain-containing protein [Tricharina praecox]|uniref:chromosome segregation protein Spc25-domain-containing protein n=1 Tax=Tricharina praecox TaxID=43433 RepID=UPI0022200CB1|nr:chromosome segregation protein Spc25-domain-containing protein [Tricharina praecox]KAI5857124.1 chromosome segregation protein Spc25-domain-containing protein [Tricharina praecox]